MHKQSRGDDENQMFTFNALRSNNEWLLSEHEVIGGTAFHRQAYAWSRQLPHRSYVVVLCNNHQNFMTAFLAAQLSGQTVLLPAARSPGAIESVRNEFPDTYYITDQHDGDADGVGCDALRRGSTHIGDSDETAPVIPADHIAAIVFTSGSTGRPIPHRKTWSGLIRGAQLAQIRFGFSSQDTIVATVPPQHMYGLETSIMVPLVCGTRIYSGRPFFPEDVRCALKACPENPILVTTPVHLRACIASKLTWPKTKFIISATAPISETLVNQTEQVFETALFEIYGCTEAGSLASRRTAQSAAWQLYDDFSISQDCNDTVVAAPHLEEAVQLSDVIDLLSEHSFLLRGRNADMVNIAGKRASLADLNLKLRDVPGVIDGVYVAPDSVEGATVRLTALVVAPDVSEAQIMAHLAAQIDPAFLPRPLHRVDSLPHNEVGKIPRQSLITLLEKLERVA